VFYFNEEKFGKFYGFDTEFWLKNISMVGCLFAKIILIIHNDVLHAPHQPIDADLVQTLACYSNKT
jgi:hypothetical protein